MDKGGRGVGLPLYPMGIEGLLPHGREGGTSIMKPMVPLSAVSPSIMKSMVSLSKVSLDHPLEGREVSSSLEGREGSSIPLEGERVAG